MDHLGGCPNDLGLVPLTFRVQEFALVVGDERPFPHQHRKRFLVCFQYFYLKVICYSVNFFRLFTSLFHFVPFFQEVPFDMENENEN